MKKMMLAVMAPITIYAALGSASAYSGDSDIAYYEQFLYRMEAIDDGEEITYQYRWLQSSMMEFPVDENHIYIVDMSLFLLDTMKFEFRYREMYKFRENSNAPWQFDPPSFCPTKVKGEWSVPETPLILGDVGTGARAFDVNSMNAVQITLSRNLGKADIKDKPLILMYGYANHSMDDQPPFCPK